MGTGLEPLVGLLRSVHRLGVRIAWKLNITVFRLLKNLLRLIDPEYAQLLERWVATLLVWGDKPKQRV